MGGTKKRATAIATTFVVLLTGCRGEADKTAAPATTSTTVTTSTTLPTQVAGLTLDAPTTSTARTPTSAAAAGPTTTSRSETRGGAHVNDAPREAHTQRSDNSGSVEYDATPTAASSRQEVTRDDPLEFFAVCQVAADGHGSCSVDLVNRVTRNAVFPDGLKIALTMQRQGASSPVVFEFPATSISSLRPGEQAHVEATFDLTEQGRYDYFATTTVAWP